jgi:hypothetical protein
MGDYPKGAKSSNKRQPVSIARSLGDAGLLAVCIEIEIDIDIETAPEIGRPLEPAIPAPETSQHRGHAVQHPFCGAGFASCPGVPLPSALFSGIDWLALNHRSHPRRCTPIRVPAFSSTQTTQPKRKTVDLELLVDRHRNRPSHRRTQRHGVSIPIAIPISIAISRPLTWGFAALA